MIYVDEDMDSIYCGETIEAARDTMKRDAEKYFVTHPEMDTFKMCLIDWDTNKSTVYVFEQQRNITCTEY